MGVYFRSQSSHRRWDKHTSEDSDRGAFPSPKQTERKKNHATTQILPMEEGQDVEACSVNEKNVRSLATQLQLTGEDRKVVSSVNVANVVVNENATGCYPTQLASAYVKFRN